MDNFGALLEKEKSNAKGTAVLAAGPLFFMDMELPADRRPQEIAKASAIARCLEIMNLLAFAPARNEWAAGDLVLQKLREESGASMLAANVRVFGAFGTVGPASTVPSAQVGLPPAGPQGGGTSGMPGNWIVKDVGGLKLGILGVSEPDKAKLPLDGVTSQAPSTVVASGVEALKKEGARAIVVLAAVGRGEAKRIADHHPDLLAIVVGGVGGDGDANTKAPPAEHVGDVLIVETANHLQTVAVLDLFVRDGSAQGLVKFQDATGIERTRKREELTERISDLRARIAMWETDTTVAQRDIDARKNDLGRLEAERDALDEAKAPPSGSFYRYAMHEVRDNLGAQKAVRAQMLAYYKYVNESNKEEFASRLPPKPARGEPGYVGVDACTDCHQDSRASWNKTAHARAYATLSNAYKEFNLDCVSCHVTGYDRPGGSTVTHVDGLKDVQCEACHGPGQNHVRDPSTVKIPVARPGTDTCLSCHRPPHVHAFDAQARMNEILGPGHGRPK
jgi:hypothetical protein